VNVVVNGDPRVVDAGATVADLVVLLGHRPSGAGVAAAVNGEVVRRAEWPSTPLGEGDRLEILAATQGG
jgi:sulfur carrier protein